MTGLRAVQLQFGQIGRCRVRRLLFPAAAQWQALKIAPKVTGCDGFTGRMLREKSDGFAFSPSQPVTVKHHGIAAEVTGVTGVTGFCGIQTPPCACVCMRVCVRTCARVYVFPKKPVTPVTPVTFGLISSVYRLQRSVNPSLNPSHPSLLTCSHGLMRIHGASRHLRFFTERETKRIDSGMVHRARGVLHGGRR